VSQVVTYKTPNLHQDRVLYSLNTSQNNNFTSKQIVSLT